MAKRGRPKGDTFTVRPPTKGDPKEICRDNWTYPAERVERFREAVETHRRETGREDLSLEETDRLKSFLEENMEVGT